MNDKFDSSLRISSHVNPGNINSNGFSDNSNNPTNKFPGQELLNVIPFIDEELEPRNSEDCFFSSVVSAPKLVDLKSSDFLLREQLYL